MVVVTAVGHGWSVPACMMSEVRLSLYAGLHNESRCYVVGVRLHPAPRTGAQALVAACLLAGRRGQCTYTDLTVECRGVE